MQINATDRKRAKELLCELVRKAEDHHYVACEGGRPATPELADLCSSVQAVFIEMTGFSITNKEARAIVLRE